MCRPSANAENSRQKILKLINYSWGKQPINEAYLGHMHERLDTQWTLGWKSCGFWSQREGNCKKVYHCIFFLLYRLRSHLRNPCFGFHQGFQTPRKNKSTLPAASCFHLFLGVWNPWWNPRTRFWYVSQSFPFWLSFHKFLQPILLIINWYWIYTIIPLPYYRIATKLVATPWNVRSYNRLHKSVFIFCSLSVDHCSFDWFIDWLIDWWMDGWMDWSPNPPIDRLIDVLINSAIYFFRLESSPLTDLLSSAFVRIV